MRLAMFAERRCGVHPTGRQRCCLQSILPLNAINYVAYYYGITWASSLFRTFFKAFYRPRTVYAGGLTRHANPTFKSP